MNTNQRPSIADVLDLLRRLDDSAVGPGGVTSQFLEIRKGQQGQGLSVNGNRGGLVHLARLVLEVAEKGFPGAHQHLDEAGEVDISEAPLVVGFKLAEWDA